jgi:hypothetical protein
MAAITALAVGAVTGIANGISSSNQAKKARGKAAQQERKLARLEANRQPIVNPYEGVEDLSGMISNPFSNLGVATQAAEMQAEEADIALANTLDTIRETGGAAGGATALAQMALKSKKGVSAGIEAQEAHNERLKAKGEQDAERLKMGEAQRMQQAEVSGKSFMFETKEGREVAQLNRTAGLSDRYAQQAAQHSAAATNAFMGVGSTVVGALGSGAFDPTTPTPLVTDKTNWFNQQDPFVQSDLYTPPPIQYDTGGNN